MIGSAWKDKFLLEADASPVLSMPLFQGLRTASAVRTGAAQLLECAIKRRAPEPAELRQLFESLGVTYVKLGQFIGSSPSLFPAEYVEAFQDCFDQTQPVSFSLIAAVIEQQIDAPLESVFSSIDEKPLASASIAQVHAARLNSGESVVLKVRKPGVESTIKADLNLMMLVTRVLEWLTPSINPRMLSGFVEAVYPYMVDECDFVREAEYLLEFRRFLEESQNDRVTVPKPYLEYSSHRLLVMQRLEGQSFAEIVRAQQQHELQSNAALTTAIVDAKKAWFDSLIDNWFFHADLHLGNLMLLDSGQVGFIDFGLVGSIDTSLWQVSQNLFTGLIRKDSQVIAESLVSIGMAGHSVDLQDFSRDIERLLQRFDALSSASGSAPGSESGDLTRLGYGVDMSSESLMMDVNSWMIELTGVSRDYGIVFPHAFTLLIKQFLYFDRLSDLVPQDSSLLDSLDDLLVMDTLVD